VFFNARMNFRALAAAMAMAMAMAGLAITASSGRAQQPRDLVIRVAVIDSAMQPVPGVALSVVRGLNQRLASGTTDSTGRSVLRVPNDTGAYQVVGRRIGYQRAVHFFAKAVADTIGIQLEMRRAVQVLDAVAVTEKEDVGRKSYHIDADDIANSTRTIIDATDIVTKLRPDMLDGRSGTCGLQNVWVNGNYIEFAPENEHALLRRGSPPPVPRSGPVFSMKGGVSPRGQHSTPQQRAANVVWSVLASIKPEHIDEINYVDCFRDPVHKRNSDNAVYVVLKPGVDFIAGLGSFVADTAWGGPARNHAARTRADSAAPAYRNRLLGVYDVRTGDPLVGADVIDVGTGTHARTTATGTVGLGYLAEGANKVRVHRDGYRDEELEVLIGPAQTLPVMVLLTPAP
jgi:hypothetical protein